MKTVSIIDEDGIYRETTQGLAPLNNFGKAAPRGTISKWPREKRAAFERELTAGIKSMAQIAEKYGISPSLAYDWKRAVLKPALVAAAQVEDIERQGNARQYLNWLGEVTRTAITEMTEGKVVTDAEGNETVEMGDPKRHGTVASLIGQGLNHVKMLGELTGEFREAEAAAGVSNQPTIIRVITMPKSTDQVGVEVTMPQQRPPLTLTPVIEE